MCKNSKCCEPLRHLSSSVIFRSSCLYFPSAGIAGVPALAPLCLKQGLTVLAVLGLNITDRATLECVGDSPPLLSNAGVQACGSDSYLVPCSFCLWSLASGLLPVCEASHSGSSPNTGAALILSLPSLSPRELPDCTGHTHLAGLIPLFYIQLGSSLPSVAFIPFTTGQHNRRLDAGHGIWRVICCQCPSASATQSVFPLSKTHIVTLSPQPPFPLFLSLSLFKYY